MASTKFILYNFLPPFLPSATPRNALSTSSADHFKTLPPRVPPPRESFLSMTASPATHQTAARSPPSESFTWTNQWYPIAWTADVPNLKPVPFRLWQRHFVLFRDIETGNYIVLDDTCPHRLAPLSEGRIYQRHHEGREQTILECGYHGWRFDCSGCCVDIPVAQSSKRIPGEANVKGVYTTRVAKFGLIFMWWGKPAEADDAKFPVPHALDTEDDLTVFQSMARSFPLSFTTVLENVADPAHVPWSHHGTGQGNRNNVTRGEGVALEEDRIKEGYARVSFKGRPGGPARVGEMQMPTYIGYRNRLPGFGLSLVAWALPEDREESKLFSAFVFVDAPRAVKRRKRRSRRWLEHVNANLILDGDAMLLQGQEKRLQDLKRDGFGGAWKRSYVLTSGKFDMKVIKLREFLDMYGPSMPFRTAPSGSRELLSREVVIDRYENHTKNCACCAPALRNIRRGLLATLIVAGLCAMTSLFAGVVLMSVRAEHIVRVRVTGIGIAGMIGCLVALGFASLLSRWKKLLTFTDISYRLSHAE